MQKLKNTIEKLIDTSKYEEVCELVKEKFGIEYECKFLKNDYHFNNDTSTRDIYEITLKRGTRDYTFNFGQSINCSGKYVVRESLRNKVWVTKYTQGKIHFTLKEFKNIPSYIVGKGDIHKNTNFKEPTLYDILTCLTKYDPGTLEDFCSEFGYDIDSKSAEKTYLTVKEEWKNVQTIWTDKEIELLIEIE
jgi:hypothetical protein